MFQEFHLKTRQRRAAAGRKQRFFGKQMGLSGCKDLVTGQGEQNWILVTLSRPRDSGLQAVEATKGCGKDGIQEART